MVELALGSGLKVVAQSIGEPHLIDLDVYFAARTADIGAAVGKLRSMILL